MKRASHYMSFRVPMTVEERARLESLARSYGQASAPYVRGLIAREAKKEARQAKPSER